MKSPPKGKRPALASKPGVRLAAAYYATLALLANVFGVAALVFGAARPADRIATEGAEQ